MQSTLQISLSQKQADFLTSDAFACLFASGIGSGKSFIGAHWAKEQIVTQPHCNGFIAANTYNQLRNATLTTFFSILDEHNFKWKYNQQRNIIYVNGVKIYAYSLDLYHNIRGIEFGWGWLDETRDTEQEAFDVVLGRLRDRRAYKRMIRLTSSPCGFNWLHDYFAGPNKKSGYEIVQGSSRDNIYLPEGYVESLKNAYDPKMYQQEVEGQFVSTNVGQVYYAFDRENHVRPVAINDRFPLLIGMDFNVNPMTAVICQSYDNKIHVVDEVWLMSSNTEEMAMELKRRYPNRHLRVIPDSTGNAQKTSQKKGKTDHQILRDFGLEVVFNLNPARFDRYVCVNNLFDKGRMYVDPKCKHLITDLEKLTYKHGTTEPDSSKINL
jgi:PBSX family phage terminase large subunit